MLEGSSLDGPSQFPQLKSFSLTHILYDPSHPTYISIPLTLLSLSPIFLFVSYFTLIIFNRRLTLFLLAIGSVVNEILSWGLKRSWKSQRPYVGLGEVGDGYGMPSSHSQAAAFLVAWGFGYAMTMTHRYPDNHHTNRTRQSPLNPARLIVRRVRISIYLFGLALWSILTAYSRCHLLYHTPYQVIVGYTIGLVTGTVYFIGSEYVPLYYPQSVTGRIRYQLERIWLGIGGIGGWDLGGSEGGWLDGPWMDRLVDGGNPETRRKKTKSS